MTRGRRGGAGHPLPHGPAHPPGRGRAVRGTLLACGLLAGLLAAGGHGAADARGREPGAANRIASRATTVEDFAWLAGSWRGPGPGGAVAEIHFMRPEAGTLPSIFRLRQDGRVVVLETISLVERDGGVVMYVRHFDTALVPLEKELAIELRLVERRGDAFVFRNVNEGQNPVRSVMTRTGEGFTSVSYLARPDGSTDEIRVAYRRSDAGR